MTLNEAKQEEEEEEEGTSQQVIRQTAQITVNKERSCSGFVLQLLGSRLVLSQQREENRKIMQQKRHFYVLAECVDVSLGANRKTCLMETR